MVNNCGVRLGKVSASMDEHASFQLCHPKVIPVQEDSLGQLAQG